MRKPILEMLRAVVFVVFILFRFLVFMGGIYIAFFGFSIAVVAVLFRKIWAWIRPFKGSYPH